MIGFTHDLLLLKNEVSTLFNSFSVRVRERVEAVDKALDHKRAITVLNSWEKITCKACVHASNVESLKFSIIASNQSHPPNHEYLFPGTSHAPLPKKSWRHRL